ncbi:hypothetical protein KCU65_g3372, partial [Aureobasidium melanogenum]
MSDLPSSSTGTIADDRETSIGGTSFLDLPLELRLMVYDLSIARIQTSKFPLPGQPKPHVSGINLLQSCKQIRKETHERIWRRSWTVDLPLSNPSGHDSIDLNLAMSSLNDLTLAKIDMLKLHFDIDPNSVSWGPINLEKLSALKSLLMLRIVISIGRPTEMTKIEPEDFGKSVFITGLVTQILPQIARGVRFFHLAIGYWDSDCVYRISTKLGPLIKKYECLRGLACES